jgi:hypothetical protein
MVRAALRSGNIHPMASELALKQAIEWAKRPRGRAAFSTNTNMDAKITKITIARLYNLGNYEHERFEIEVAVPEGASAARAMVAVERILSELNPKCPVDVSAMMEADRRFKWSDEDWQRSRWEPSWQQAKADNAQKLKELTFEYTQWKQRQARVRRLLDDLGTASHYRDAKQNWEDDHDYFND